MSRQHRYDNLAVRWIGNAGTGTSSYRAYGRDHDITGRGLPLIPGSADPVFRGDPARWNPEQLQIIALSQCHMLWYLHFAAESGVIVTAYEDKPAGVMAIDADGGGHFEKVTLRPRVTITSGSDARLAAQLHAKVPAVCFIARSVNFPVEHEPEIVVG
ncbi:OsmC family protein [[Mycobacterium] vasticus]|uniref:OsmC family protein n=1 Tax=[Mycobacterium] vasticus TaxID=2875777 RepID=A0ABU5YYI1_9MYCO|nr:OsmC family protein [Mycolicibacter sp. MYC017]MEB3068773.1 OsmC family protein [Mycolicibacter sp. MYC017]